MVEPGVAVVGGVEEGGVGGDYFVDFAAGKFGAKDWFEGEHGLGVGHALVGEGGEAAAAEYTAAIEGLTDSRCRLAVRRYGEIVFHDSYATADRGEP